MEFYLSKVYTPVTADEVKVGSKGFFADNLNYLKKEVEDEKNDDSNELVGIEKNNYTNFRFTSKDGNSYQFFYLKEEPQEKQYRPYNDTDEMVADFKKRFNADCPEYELPLIWIEDRASKAKSLITDFYKCMISTSDLSASLSKLFNYFTYLDGSPCGMEE